MANKGGGGEWGCAKVDEKVATEKNWTSATTITKK